MSINPNKWSPFRKLITAATVLLPLAMAGVLQGQSVTNIIYQDTFARTGVLDGSAPDTVNLPGATWKACNNPGLNAQLRTDGSEIALTNTPGTTNGIYLNGFLPFTPQVGHIYTLNANVVVLSGGNQWLAMGFAVQARTNNFFAAVNCGAGFNLIRGNGTGVQPYRFPGGAGNIAQKTAAFGTTTNLFTVVLDTTTGTGAARGWTYRFFTNSVQIDSYSTANVNPTMIQYVGIGADAAQGYFQNFTLTDIMVHQGLPTIVEQPQNRTAQVGQTATFWVGVTNDFPSAAYQWMTNSTGGSTNAIAGATNATYTTLALDMTYNGLNYTVAITNALGATNSAPATLTVVSGPPSVYSATKTTNTTKIVVAFSKAVAPVTGLNAANYALTINGAPSGVSVLSASYGSTSNSVILTTSTLNTNTGYYLNVQNVQDSIGNAMSGITTVPVLPAGLVLLLRGDSGVVLDANNNVVQWLDQTTNGNNAVQFFGVPSVGLIGSAARPGVNIINNGQPSVDFGNLGTGVSLLHWLQAPTSPSLESMQSNTTMYAVADFYSTAGNDLVNKTWGNLPASFDWAPGGGETIQYGNGFNNGPASGTGGTLTANTPLVLASTLSYPVPTTNVYAFYLNGNPNGNGTVRAITGNPPGLYDGKTPLWIGGRSDLQAANPKMRGQIAEIMLFNTTLSGADRTNVDNYLGQKYYAFSITQDLPASTTSSNGFAVTYTFVASQGSVHGFALQWQENGTNIPGATSTTYTTPVLGPGDNGETYDVVVTFPNGSTTTSTVNTLTVVSQPPYVTATGIPIWNTNQVYVFFDETSVDPATATTAANYSLNNGATVLSAAIGDAPNKVILTTSPLTFNANPGFYTLTVSGVMDLYGNTITSASSPVGLYPATALWVKANTGVTPDGGGGVNGWSDLSGNGNNFSGFSGATDPVLTNNNYGDTVLRFTGTNDSEMYALSSPTLAITGDMSVFAVMNFANLTGGTNGEIISKTAPPGFSTAAPYDYYMGTSGALLYRGNGPSFGQYTATAVPSTGVPHIIGMTEQGNTVNHFIDGNPAGTGLLGGYNESSDADAGQFLQIGARGDNHNRLNGDIAELIIASTGSMSSNDIALLDNYLSLGHRLPIGSNSFAVITQQPVASTNIGFNTTLSIPVGVSGNPLALQWYDTNGVTIAGQTNATLTITNDQTSDAYYLVASNAFGPVTSIVVSVTVVNGLIVSLGPPSTALYVGKPFTFTAQAVGNLPLHYQWYQAASPIPNATNASYSTVASLGTTSYSCTVTNPYNGLTSTNAGPVTLTGIAQPTNAFSQVVLARLPVAYWRLNEPSGSLTAYDYVGGYNGTYGVGTTNGLPGVPFAGASGELGVAMDNTLISGFITTPGVNINTNTVTIVCWANLFANQFNPSGLVYCRTNATTAGYHIGGGNAVCYNWNNDPTTYNYNSGDIVSVNAWSFIVIAVAPTGATFYVGNSGTLSTAAQAYSEPPQDFSAGLAIGADPQGFTLPNRIFNGEMDEVAIYNYTLSASQVSQLYTAAITGVTGLVNNNPTNIVFSASGGNLTLSWPADHTGWRLQSQTNSVAVGLSTNWANVANATTTNKVIVPIVPANGSVFYRLVYP